MSVRNQLPLTVNDADGLFSNKKPSVYNHSGASKIQVGGMDKRSEISRRRSPVSRRSPTKNVETRNSENTEPMTMEEPKRKPPTRKSPRKSPAKKSPSSDDYDDYDDEESEDNDDNGKKERKTRKSPRKTKRKVNKWAEMIGYITNSVAAEVGFPIRAEEFMGIIRKNYPGNPPTKKKISKDLYAERAKAKLQILKEVDTSLIDKANKSIAEIVQTIKKESR